MSDAESDRVRDYFSRAAERFDLIYSKDKSLRHRLVDSLFRGVVQRRLELNLQLCGAVDGKRILDVGCGSGRYAIELARRGARVVGIDPAQGMLDLARRAAEEAGVSGRCTFVADGFLAWPAEEPFDLVLANGLFDYTRDPGPFLARMRQLCLEKGLFSFPIRWRLRTPTRWLRLTLSGCPVHFYGRRRVEALVREAGWESVRVYRLSRDYLVEAGRR